MKSAMFETAPGMDIGATLEQLASLGQFPELDLVGGMGRAAMVGSYSYASYPVYKVVRGLPQLEDLDFIARNGAQDPAIRGARFLDGPHLVDIGLQIRLNDARRCDNYDPSVHWRLPIPDFPQVASVERTINGSATFMTLPIGMQLALDALCPYDGEHGQAKAEFAEFAQALRMRSDVPQYEFPDRAMAEVLQLNRWRGPQP